MKLLLALLLPSTLLTVSCVAGAALIIAGRRVRRVRQVGSILFGFGILALSAALLLPIDLWLLRPLEDRFAMQTPDAVDGIVVLGGAIALDVSRDRALPTLNRDGDRLVAFTVLAKAHPNARLIFAGGSDSAIDGPRLTEAAASRQLFEQLGVTTGRVEYDDQSRTTWENAVNALALAHPNAGETWVLITSASHMPRAIGAFRRAGWPQILAWPVAYRTTKSGWPKPMQPIGARLMAIDLAAHEWIGLAEYRIQGRTDRLFPKP